MICCVIGASEEAIYAIKLAKSRGHYVIAFDGDEKAAGLRYADESHVVDISNPDNIYKILDEENRKIEMLLPTPIGRILAVNGQVNSHYALNGISAESADLCTDKLEFHNALAVHGYRNVKCFLLKNRAQAESYEDYPAVVKLRYGAGSRGIHVVENKAQLLSLFDECEEELADNDYIIEQMAPGTEYGVDGTCFEGKMNIVLLRKKLMTKLPDRQCVGYISVKKEDIAGQLWMKIEDLMQNVIESLKMNHCVFHADLMIDGSQVFVIEISARPSGHRLNNIFTPMATGVSVVEEYLKYQEGKRYNVIPKDVKKLMIRYFDFEDVYIKKVPDESYIREKYPIVQYECNIKAGDYMQHVTDGHSIMGRGYFIVEASGDEELANIGEKVLKEFGLSDDTIMLGL